MDSDGRENAQPSCASVAPMQHVRQAWVDAGEAGGPVGCSHEASPAVRSEASAKLCAIVQEGSIEHEQRGPPDASLDGRWASTRKEQLGLDGRQDGDHADRPSQAEEGTHCNQMDHVEVVDTLDLASARDTARHSVQGAPGERAKKGSVSARQEQGALSDADSEPLPAVSFATKAPRAVYNKDDISSESSDGE